MTAGDWRPLTGLVHGIAAGALLMALICSVMPAHAAAPDIVPLAVGLPPGPPWLSAHVVDALAGQPVLVRRILYCETGRSGRYDPYAVGGMGEVGPAQLLPGVGNGLSIFYAWGFTDPTNPYQAVAWVNEVIDRNMIASQYPRTSQGCRGSP